MYLKFSVILYILFSVAAMTSCQRIKKPVSGTPKELPLRLSQHHINLVLSVANAEQVHKFYGEVLGMKHIGDYNVNGQVDVVQYVSGASTLKFVLMGRHFAQHQGDKDSARGIRSMTVRLPMSRHKGLSKRLQKGGLPAPIFKKRGKITFGNAIEFATLYDYDGNAVEVVFLDETATASEFERIDVGLVVSDVHAMNRFMTNILGFRTQEIDGDVYRFPVGKSSIRVWQVEKDTPTWICDVIKKPRNRGFCYVQFLVNDIDQVRQTIIERNGKIYVEPFNIPNTASIMLIEGPDGILFEFVGPPQLHKK